MTVESAIPSEDTEFAALISRISGLLARGGGSLTPGDVAALKRMSPRNPHAAFFKLEGIELDEHLPSAPVARFDSETRWAAIVVGLSHLGKLHRQGVRLGSSLVDAGFSEPRFARLLRSDADRLVDDLPMLARFLSAKDVPVDWSQAGLLLLSSGRRDEEHVRRNIARDFYRRLAQTS